MIDLSEAIVPFLPAIEVEELCEYEYCRRSDKHWFSIKLLEPMTQEHFEEYGWWIMYSKITSQEGDVVWSQYIHVESLPEPILAILELHRIEINEERQASRVRERANPLRGLLQPLIDAGIAQELPEGILPEGIAGVTMKKPKPETPPNRNQAEVRLNFARWRSQGWRLIDTNSNMELPFGEIVRDPAGDEWELVGGYPPQVPGSTGRIYVNDQDGCEREFFPSVFDLKWIGASQQ